MTKIYTLPHFNLAGKRDKVEAKIVKSMLNFRPGIEKPPPNEDKNLIRGTSIESSENLSRFQLLESARDSPRMHDSKNAERLSSARSHSR